MDEYLEGIMGRIKPQLVACRCGWNGEQRDLGSEKFKTDRFCPACGEVFKSWPPLPNQDPYSH